MAGEPKVNRRNTIAKKGGRPEGSGKFDEKITATFDEQGKLDEKKKNKCPNCGIEF